MLSPNALRVLDSLGVYQRIRSKGYHFETVIFKDADEETIDHYAMGSEKEYGYKALRIYREILLSELRAMVEEAHIPVKYEKKFTHVVSHDEKGVTFAFADGSIETSTLLVGADGIHSSVRKHISQVSPVYSGQLAITCAMPKSSVTFPPNIDYPLPAGVFAKPGAFMMAPQDVNGEEILAGTQCAYPEQDRAGWDKLMSSKADLLRLFQKDMPDWPGTVQSALRNVPLHTLSIWPYYVVPKLDSWTSPDARVLILGDAAHAIPPTAGQGASQAFEDSFTLAILLSQTDPKDAEGFRSRALRVWQTMRQERVERVIALTEQLNNARLPQAEREAKKAQGDAWQGGKNGGLAWLYNERIGDRVLECISAAGAR